MRKIIFVLFIVTSISCDSNHIKVTSIVYTTPAFRVENNGDPYITHDKNTLRVFLFNQEIIYRLPEFGKAGTENIVPNTESYFICSKNSKTGTFYKTNIMINKNGYTKMSGLNVDSFLSIHAFGSTKMEEPVEFYKKVTKTIGDTLINTFILLDTSKLLYHDTITYKLRHFKEKPFFNFAKRMDSVYNKSLFYFSFIHRKKYLPQVNRIEPTHVLKAEFSDTELNESESKKFIELIHKLKSTYK